MTKSADESEQLTPALKLEKWGPGPWVDEPDHVEFRHNGVPCILHRNHSGAWCGYAACEPGHPWHGLKYDDRVPLTDEIRNRETGGERAVNWIGVFCHAATEDDGKIAMDLAVEVHGGLTYSRACQGDICHVPQEGETDGAWWLGFDCSHAGDKSPGHGMFSFSDGVYRDETYVRRETEHLAEQIIAARAQVAP